MNSVDKYPEKRFWGRYITREREKEREFFPKVDYHRKYSFLSLWMLFFSFSFVGWLWEVAYHWFSRGQLVNRGALFGPWVPIYGTAAVLILKLLRRWVDRPLRVYLSVMVIAALIEYFTSYALELVMGIRFWDYSRDFMNLNGRIYLEGITFFGLGGCAALYLMAPVLDELHKRIPSKIRWILVGVLTFIFIADVVHSYYYPNTANGLVYIRGR